MSKSDEWGEESETGYLLSISDMTSGLLFIFIIVLAIFIVNFKVVMNEQKEINEQLTQSNKLRKDLLEKVQLALKKQGINVAIDTDRGVLRLTENTIRFITGEAKLSEQQLKRLDTIGGVLTQLLPCYSSSPESLFSKRSLKVLSCDSKHKGKIDSIFIEGHTDNVPMGPKLRKIYQDNWELSAARSIYTYRYLIQSNSALSNMKNTLKEPVFSVSSYGEGRPVHGHHHRFAVSDPVNRRIDIRFIMTPPLLINRKK